MTSSRPSHELPEPPAWLDDNAASFFRTVVRDYSLEDFQLYVLTAAAEALHRYDRAREVLDAEGPTYTTGAGMIRQRPEVVVLRDSRIAFLRATRDLGLDVEAGD